MEPFYALDGRLEQLRFLEHWLKDVDTGITREPPVKLAIRRSRDDHVWRYLGEDPADLVLANPGSKRRPVVVGFTLAAPADRHTRAQVRVPGEPPQALSVGPGGRRVNLRVSLAPGTTRIRIDGSGPSQTQRPDVGLPYDLLVQDAVVIDEAVAALGPASASRLPSNAGSPFID